MAYIVYTSGTGFLWRQVVRSLYWLRSGEPVVQIAGPALYGLQCGCESHRHVVSGLFPVKRGVIKCHLIWEMNMLDSEKVLELAIMFDRTKKIVKMLTRQNQLVLQIPDGNSEAILNVSAEDGGAGADFMGQLSSILEQFSNSIAHRIQDEVRRGHMD